MIHVLQIMNSGDILEDLGCVTGDSTLNIMDCQRAFKALKLKSVRRLNLAGYSGDNRLDCFISYLVKVHRCKRVSVHSWEIPGC